MKAASVIKVSPIDFHSIRNAVSVEHGYLDDHHLLFAPCLPGTPVCSPQAPGRVGAATGAALLPVLSQP